MYWLHLSVVRKHLQSGLQSSAESCALSWAHLRVCSLQDIYLKRCKSRAAKIIKDSSHPGNRLFFYCHLESASGAWWQKLREEELLPPGHLASKLKLVISTWLNLINSKIFTILHHPYCCYVYTLYNLFAHSSCTSLLTLLFIKSTVLHIFFIAHFLLLYCLLLFIFYLYLCLFSCVVLHILHCPLSGPDLTYISLLIKFCIIEYVMNKTLNPWILLNNELTLS